MADSVDSETMGAGVGRPNEPLSDIEGINWKDREQEDDALLSSFLAKGTGNPGDGDAWGLANFENKDIDQTNKADDAMDYEDMSDDELPEDEEMGPATTKPSLAENEDDGADDGADDGFDDLFGEDDGEGDGAMPSLDAGDGPSHRSSSPVASPKEARPLTAREIFELNFPKNVLEPQVEHWVNAQATHQDGPAPPENIDELLSQTYPSWGPDKILNFRELFAEWPADYLYKEPPKSPPDLVPTKLELELDSDTSKLFRIPEQSLANNQKKSHQAAEEDNWDVPRALPALEEDETLSDSDDENQLVGGRSLNEIATVCEDWDNFDSPKPSGQQNGLITLSDDEPLDEPLDEWQLEMFGPRQAPAKRKRKFEPGLPDISDFEAWGIDRFEDATKISARRILLDMNDPYLLITDMLHEQPNKRPRLEERSKRMANGQLGRDVFQRFNISNDEAYNALKANNRNKVRATLSNLAVEHSMPALKLTFPFYRTKYAGEFWEHHRKKFDLEKIVRHSINFRKPSKVKRREAKGKSTQEVFRTTKDLSLNDNSTTVLFEYCEQNPIMLSNFGMGNRVINYFRRSENDDEEKRPKADIGEPHALMPEDRSPFSIFGDVEPGEPVLTLHNEMYRAPIFKHEPKRTDFILGYTTNVAEGPRWYLRAIDHLFVVGQTFPSMEVPGPHARKVTNTSKNRLKMIAYRLMRKSPAQDVGLKQVTAHVWEKDDAQNRQKLKEFLTYDRDARTWVMPEGQTLMDETGIRAMIKPEDVCLIESMQIGSAQLQNAGFDSKTNNFGNEDDEPGAEEELIAKMAPWEITKNFLEASAGKAMVTLHGEGDPTGCGKGFSFIKTSMKGGYINAVAGPNASSQDYMNRERKSNGGHSYNVKEQEFKYKSAIKDIWSKQKASLSDQTTHEDSAQQDLTNEDDRLYTRQQSTTGTVNYADDGRSALSRLSGVSRQGKRKIKITRRVRTEGGELKLKSEVIDDPAVVRSYMRQRADLKALNTDVYKIRPTGDADADREKAKLISQELSRLLKNADRRQVREKQGKGKRKSANPNATSSDPSGAAEGGAGGTTRKCANCGQVGHIKTNKSKCPLLNGTITNPNNGAEEGGFGSFSAPASGAQVEDSG